MRINLISPGLLADQHLVAEYREIKMLPKALLRSMNSKKGLVMTRISPVFILNTGHGYFFYNKIGFIIKRFNEIIQEMQSRGFATNYTTLSIDWIPEYLKNDYTPPNKEILVSLERIEDRISQKPEFYKYRGNQQDWGSFYNGYKGELYAE